MIVLKDEPAVKYHSATMSLRGERIEFEANGRKARGYLSTPEQGRGPGVIVIQEYWGLVDHIKKIADRFASEGYVALAPDLYHGESTKSPDEAGKLMMALRIEETEKDLQGAVRALRARSTGEKLGAVGFCMGGQLALFAASKNEAIGPVVDFYGIHPNVKPDYARMRGPVLGLFAENDEYVSGDAVQDLARSLDEAGIERDFHTYPGAHHAFFNDERKEVYDPAAAEDAWRRVMELLGKNL